MPNPEIVRTTLGDLVAAITDEITAAMGDSSDTYIVVSYIMSDLLKRRPRTHSRSGANPARNGKARRCRLRKKNQGTNITRHEKRRVNEPHD
jgi:hypothetical protein